MVFPSPHCLERFTLSWAGLSLLWAQVSRGSGEPHFSLWMRNSMDSMLFQSQKKAMLKPQHSWAPASPTEDPLCFSSALSYFMNVSTDSESFHCLGWKTLFSHSCTPEAVGRELFWISLCTLFNSSSCYKGELTLGVIIAVRHDSAIFCIVRSLQTWCSSWYRSCVLQNSS